MTTPALSLWLANVFLDTAGRLFFKSAANAERVRDEGWHRQFRSPALWAGVLCFCLEFVAWLALLSLIPLSQAILIGSINIATVAIAGRLLFGEPLYRARVVAVALIAVGVALAGAG